MIEIEKNVPVPSNRTKYPFKDMEVGDSFFASQVNPRSLRTLAWRHRPKKFTVHKEGEGYRCWRTQ